MTQTSGRFFDEIGKLMTDAAGAAQGVRKEMQNAVRGQVERVMAQIDVVKRDEFDAVKAMAQKAREENAQLRADITALEAVIAGLHGGAPETNRPVRKTARKKRS
ncbi:Membrane fusogenic activity [Methyloligella halotolerans]|uniref:Membrane fusogenic activity n=1 Tax=Methyloligella halotolerans TaxID=1177755 RepID=A0A1E2RXW3_9HYPH|nr:accessory factor UbiK family protein [Methyloligella halotolerans]ODA66938.1 Membrane fusogenic activity [Methyloligella halotolerans]